MCLTLVYEPGPATATTRPSKLSETQIFRLWVNMWKMVGRQLSWNFFWWKGFGGKFSMEILWLETFCGKFGRKWHIWYPWTPCLSKDSIGSWKHFVCVCVCVCVTLSLSFCKSFVINEMFVIHHLCLACWPCCMLPVIVCMVASHYWANAGQMLLWQGGPRQMFNILSAAQSNKIPPIYNSTFSLNRKKIYLWTILSFTQGIIWKTCPFIALMPPTYNIMI